jgi:phosphate-selective porin OprO/OprP
MFSGRANRPFGYFLSISNGFDTLTLLDVFLDIDYDPRLRLRIGRYKTPFTYEFFVEPIQGLVIPERSVFFNNFGLNRDLGIMAFGRLAQNTLDYAVGIYNGTSNGFLDQDNEKDFAAFANWKPFGVEQNTLLENFNIGGSVYGGQQDHVPVPQTFRTIVPTTGNAIAGVPFLSLNNNVINSGPKVFWDLHAAWFYQQLAVLGEWGSGFEDYAFTSNPAARTHLGVESFYLQASYLLTGETRSSIGIVKPRCPFDIRKGKFGIGAIEPFVRYEYLDISNKVFTNGLSDPNLWANRMFQTHVGFNWHLTQYVKFYFDWNHSEFNQPVLFSPGRRQLTSETFMARIQLYF